MEKYFLQFDFYNNEGDYNKFYYGIVDLDLNEKGLRDHCMAIIKAKFEIDLLSNGVSTGDLVIKVNQLNNFNL